MENLDVMRHAVCYNKFLLDQITGALQHINKQPPVRVMDFGAGNGRFLEALRIDHGIKYAVENDPEYQRVLQKMPGITVFSSLYGIEINSINLAWSFNVLEHIKDDQAALAELVGQLKPGGRLVLFVPAYSCLYNRMDERVGHLRRYTGSGLIKMVDKAGARVISVEYVDSLGFFAAAAYGMLGGSGVLTPNAVKFYDRFIFPVSRILDLIAGPFFGKNILVHAVKPLPNQAD